MKKIALIILAILTMTMANGQTLSERQKGLAACACAICPPVTGSLLSATGLQNHTGTKAFARKRWD